MPTLRLSDLHPSLPTTEADLTDCGLAALFYGLQGQGYTYDIAFGRVDATKDNVTVTYGLMGRPPTGAVVAGSTWISVA